MKNLFHVCCVLALLVGHLPAARLQQHAPDRQTEAVRRLAYSLDFEHQGRVHVTLRTNIPDSGGELVQLPSRRGEATGLERAIQGLKITGSAVSLLPESRPWLYTMHAKPGTTVQLDYDLVQDWTGPFSEGQRHRVLLRPELVIFNGENGLVAPRMDDRAPVEVSFDLLHVPAGQVVVTSFGTETHQTSVGPWSEVTNALFAVGVFNTRRLNVGGGTVLLAVAGRWSFSEQDLARKMEKIFEAERMFWRDTSPSWSAMVLAPFETASARGGGSAFTHAFSLYMSPEEGLGPATESLAAHEAFHAWNPAALGPVADMQELGWFVEGVTTYYQDVLVRRAGLIEGTTYLARLNTLLRDDALSPQLHPWGVGLQNTLDSDEAKYREPYLRGAMVALWVNAVIGRESGGRFSLDDVMRALLAGAGRGLTTERIFAAMAQYVDGGTMTAVRKAILEGGEIPVVADSLGQCATFRTRMMWTYDPGFPNTELVKGELLKQVDPESAAYRAGLRDGQVLLGWTLWLGNSDREATLSVRQPDGSTATIRYLPRGRQVPVAQAEGSSRCAIMP